MVKFAARYKSGEVVLEEDAFTEYKWVNGEEALSLDCIKAIPGEVEETIQLFKTKSEDRG